MAEQEQFKREVQEYMQIDNDLKEASKALSVLRKRKASLSLNIYGYMHKNDVDELKLNDCRLKTFISTTTSPLNKEWIYKRLLLITNGDEAQATKMCEFICDKNARDKKEKTAVKRLKLPKPKKSENKDKN